LSALDFALHPIITIDQRGTIQSASRAVERVFGWKPAELLGQNVSMLMPEPHRSAHDSYLSRYRETGHTTILNRPRRFEAIRRSGEIFPIELSVSRADLPGDGPPLFVGIIRDLSSPEDRAAGQQDLTRLQALVTEQTRALQAAHLRLRMADRLASIGTLAAGLGHDMNNVLLPVRARLNALRALSKTNPGLPPGATEHIDSIRKSVAYLQQLADGLHFLAMDPDMDGDAHRGETTDLRKWWGQTGPLLSKAVRKGVRVTASIPAHLPEVAAAPHRLTQAMLNLVVNASEAIPADRKRREGRVRIWAKAESQHNRPFVRLAVTDNGQGMSEEVKRRAFEMFFTTKVRGLGTGLGLALVHKVALGSGGRVEIESELDKGTTVAILLPATSKADAAADAPAVAISMADGRAAALISQVIESAGAATHDGTPKHGVRIWIVDAEGIAPDKVGRWKDANPGVQVVLIGKPPPASADQWRTLASSVVYDPSNFESLRATIGRALAAY
jgi:PAS domain S-box-containing protein